MRYTLHQNDFVALAEAVQISELWPGSRFDGPDQISHLRLSSNDVVDMERRTLLFIELLRSAA
jgi:hypothetical protein